MKPVLITPVTLETTVQDRDAWLESIRESMYEPSLGILTLAASLQAGGIMAGFFDLNGFVRDLYLENADEPFQDVVAAAAPAIAELEADLFAFGTICSSYPLTVRLAEAIKSLRPEVPIFFGGPQASVVDVATLEAFPFVDGIIRGEADETIVPAFRQFAAGERIAVPGVTFRWDSEIVRNPSSSPVADLDRVPSPLFDLSTGIDQCSYLPIEAGRGCPFSCTFCSTNDFFRRKFRLRSPARVLEEMRRLEKLYGITHFDLVHDMFTVDRSRVREFCHAFLAGKEKYSWSCSARSDSVDPELIELMASAGCESIFFGIETGSPRLQKVIDKRLDISEAASMIACAAGKRVSCTVSLIVGFPEETVEDVAMTAAFALDSARFDETKVQIGLLAALSATPLFEQYKDQLFFDGIYSDLSHQTWEQNEADRGLIVRYKHLFPNFYGLPSGAGREYAAEFRHFVTYGLNRCRWLLIALGDVYGLIDVFDAWIQWRGEDRCRSRYYGTVQFAYDFCRFLRTFVAGSAESAILSALLSHYETLYSLAIDSSPLCSKVSESLASLPRISASVSLHTFPFRLSSVIEAVRRRTYPGSDWRQKTAVAFVRTEQNEINPCELPALGAAVLELCDGQTNVAQMVRALGPRCPAGVGFSAEQLIRSGLFSLRDQGLVSFTQVQQEVPVFQ